MNTDYMKQWLKENLTPERYVHSVGTAGCAVELARMYGLDEEKAYIAGLMHDCAKCKSQLEMLEIVRHKLKDMDPMETRTEKILHAPVSAYIARDGFGIKDADILSAIRWHTIGKPDMNLFESIIFIADKIDPSRGNSEFREEIIKILKENEGEKGVKKALLKCFSSTIKSLVDRSLPIFSITIETYNDLLESQK
ncbi:MAG: HD domain-containing protein [Cyanobacteria bacterium SIG30]|nr:HD domain-containing protein [Cyanobacteria bacterium SIG30]